MTQFENAVVHQYEPELVVLVVIDNDTTIYAANYFLLIHEEWPTFNGMPVTHDFS